jgi:hypothetical protein
MSWCLGLSEFWSQPFHFRGGNGAYLGFFSILQSPKCFQKTIPWVYGAYLFVFLYLGISFELPAVQCQIHSLSIFLVVYMCRVILGPHYFLMGENRDLNTFTMENDILCKSYCLPISDWI